MKLNVTSTARLAVTAGLCASLVMGGMPIQAFAAELAAHDLASQDAWVGSPVDESADAPAGDTGAPDTATPQDDSASQESANASKGGESTLEVEVAPLPQNLSVAAVVKPDGTKVGYDSLEQAIRAAEKGETIELNQDIKVATWNQIWPDGTPSKLDGITIDGKGHRLTVSKVESGLNGNYLLYMAEDVTVKDLTVNLPAKSNGFDMRSGALVNVAINGGGKGVVVGDGDVKVQDCFFSGMEYAVYTEAKAGKLEIAGSTFTDCGYASILHKTDSNFTNNTVHGGKLNVMGPEQKVQGNVFDDGSRIKFYTESVEDAFSKNNISTDSTVVFDTNVEKPVLNGNFWGSESGPAAGQLPESFTVETWYEDEGMGHLNTDPDIFKVTFVLGNGDTDKIVEVEEGKTVSKPADPEREGYMFDGWYADLDFEIAFDFSAAIAADTTVYAKWVKEDAPAPLIHKVTFVPIIGGSEIFVVEVEDGAYIELPKTPQVDGYTFAGWFLDKDFKKPFDAEKTAITGDLTLYGGWYKNDADKFVTPQGSVDKPGLPKTGDAPMIPAMLGGVVGAVALAGATADKRRKR